MLYNLNRFRKGQSRWFRPHFGEVFTTGIRPEQPAMTYGRRKSGGIEFTFSTASCGLGSGTPSNTNGDRESVFHLVDEWQTVRHTDADCFLPYRDPALSMLGGGEITTSLRGTVSLFFAGDVSGTWELCGNFFSGRHPRFM